MSNTSISTVLNLGEGVKTLIEDWLEERQGIYTDLHCTQSDLLRLLRLEVWARRHRVSVQEVLEIVVPGVREAVRSKYPKMKFKTGLGVKISSLTGEYARNMLATQIERRYPEGEQYTLWRERERALQLRREEDDEMMGLQRREREVPTLLEFDSADEYVAAYTKNVLRKRTMMQDALGEAWRRRKNYPGGNPWR
jgi:hypothetical protein